MTELLNDAFNPDSFRSSGHKLVDLLADYLDSTKNGNSGLPVLPFSTPEKLLEYWEREINNRDGSPDDLFKKVLNNSIHIHSPKYMGHQVSPALPLAGLAELLSAFLNNSLAVYEMGSPGIAMERIIIKILAGAIGLGNKADGVLTSGGTIGNLTALLAARQSKSKNNVWKMGTTDGNAPVFLVPEESHYSVERAVRIMGLGDEGIIKVPVNKKHKLDVKTVERIFTEAAGEGRNIISLVANACSTSLGLFDPLEELAGFCKEKNIWFHVDAAHGGPAVFSEKYKHLVSGLEKADSVVIDFHKMLLHPSLITAVLFRDEDDSYITFSQKAQYLWESRGDKDWYNPGKRTLECTKNAMSLKVFFTLSNYGTKLFDDNVTVLFNLGRRFAELIKERKNFNLAVEPESNIVCFRYAPDSTGGKSLNLLNKKIRQAVIENGDFFIVQTEVNGDTYFRTCLMNPFTTENELFGLLDKIEITGDSFVSDQPEK